MAHRENTINAVPHMCIETLLVQVSDVVSKYIRVDYVGGQPGISSVDIDHVV